MEKSYRPLSDQSKAYKVVEKIFDRMIAPKYLEDAVIQKLPFETAYHGWLSWDFLKEIHMLTYFRGFDLKHESIKRYVRHIVAKRRKEYEVLISMPFLARLWYFITRTVRGK